MHKGVRVEWCKAYARVKRWREEVLLLQEEMVQCLRTLEWQAKVWDQMASPLHYRGKILFSKIHLQGAMAFAARQAACGGSSVTTFAGFGIDGNGESSGGEDAEIASGGEGDGCAGEQEPGEHRPPSVGGHTEGEDAEEEGEMSREEMLMWTAEMGELLAIQGTSMGPYDDV
ncbi:hypothetical protein K438DRAFT_1779186 [Mycena galopus ATCC 62051]|nr:hypothetical protein K438DRAFT_1779186 [Mycena galopus ATCC 62051]